MLSSIRSGLPTGAKFSRRMMDAKNNSTMSLKSILFTAFVKKFLFGYILTVICPTSWYGGDYWLVEVLIFVREVTGARLPMIPVL